MSIRNLDKLFEPSSIAVIGASNRPGTVGAVVARNLFRSDFDGPIMPVNPHERAIAGVYTYQRIEDLPLVPDLAVIATPPRTIPGIVEQLGAWGTRAAVILSAGFGELGEEGRKLQQQVLDAARPHLLRVVGPNCLGVMVPHLSLNASFVHVPPKRGDIACIAQSGAVLTSIVDWATAHGIGFSQLVSLGGMADVDFGDMLDYLARDRHTRAVLLYVEAITEARKFMSAARACARSKPVIAIKAGRSSEAAKAAHSHTGALAGADAVYDAAFKRAGMLRVTTLAELFEAAETLAMGTHIAGDRLTILTNGGGMGVMAVDALSAAGGRLAELSDDTLEALNAVLPPTWSHGNPVDIIGDAPGERYTKAMDILLTETESDALLVMNCPTAIADSREAAQAVVDTLEQRRAKGPAPPVLTSWTGEYVAAEARRAFAAHRVPSYPTPDEAVRAFMHLVRYRRNQAQLMEVPPATDDGTQIDRSAARQIIQRVLETGRESLNEPEAKQVMAAYGIPVVATRTAEPRGAAVKAAAQEIMQTGAARLAIKVLSPDITHKSDVGGVVLNIDSAEEAGVTAERMLHRVRSARPEADITGISVQAMAEKKDAHELIIGMTTDPQFGPVLLFGQGGVAVEVLRDQALALPPLNLKLADEMISQTRVDRLLRGYRDRPAADRAAIAMVLIRVSQLISEVPEIAELDINPLLADENGALAVDARIRIAPTKSTGAARLAIRPYPRQLERTLTTNAGERFFVRPIKPEDAPLMQEMIHRTDREDLRLRFFSPIREMPKPMLARLSQIDYDREMALVAMPEDEKRIIGIVRIAADPDNRTAEYAVIVESALKGHGIGRLLMNAILEYAQSRGIGEITGEVLRENTGMLSLCDKLGFEQRIDDQDPGMVHVRMALT